MSRPELVDGLRTGGGVGTPLSKGSDGNEISLPLMSTPSAVSGDRLDAARVELFHRRLDGGMDAAHAHAAEKTEMEKLNALELQPFLQHQLRPGCQVPPL